MTFDLLDIFVLSIKSEFSVVVLFVIVPSVFSGESTQDNKTKTTDRLSERSIEPYVQLIYKPYTNNFGVIMVIGTMEKNAARFKNN